MKNKEILATCIQKGTVCLNDYGFAMPGNYTFDAVNDFVHEKGVSFEELQSLCLSIAYKLEQLRANNNESNDSTVKAKIKP